MVLKQIGGFIVFSQVFNLIRDLEDWVEMVFFLEGDFNGKCMIRPSWFRVI
jgi:hypothetical protein